MDPRHNPQGKRVLEDPINGNMCKTFSRSVTAAELTTTGLVLVPARKGYKYALVDCHLIANGGAAGGLTTADLVGTLNGSTRKLLAGAAANLTQSAVLRPGATGGTVLADSASFSFNDPNTPLVAARTGSALTGATSIRYTVTYAVARA